MAGTLVEARVQSPVAGWVQDQLRNGLLADDVGRFIARQPEALDQAQLVVEGIASDQIICQVPYFTRDHESTRPVCCLVEFSLNPQTGVALRR